MKAKVNINNKDLNKEFKVKRLNIDEVIVKYPYDCGLKSYKYNEVEIGRASCRERV